MTAPRRCWATAHPARIQRAVPCRAAQHLMWRKSLRVAGCKRPTPVLPMGGPWESSPARFVPSGLGFVASRSEGPVQRAAASVQPMEMVRSVRVTLETGLRWGSVDGRMISFAVRHCSHRRQGFTL